MIFKLAFLNLFRHRARFALSLLTLTGAIASTIVFRGYSHNVLDKIRLYGAENQYGHIQIGSRKLWSSDNEKLKDQLYVLSPELEQMIKSLDGLKSAAPRLSLQGLLSSGDNQLGVNAVGYDPTQETTFDSSLNLIEGQSLKDGSENGILLGSGLRDKLKVKIGDTLSLVTQTIDGIVNAGDLEVHGVFQTGVAEVDNQIAYAPIRVVHTLLDTEKVEVWTLRLRDIEQTNSTAGVLRDAIAKAQPELMVKTWRDLSDLYNRTEEFFGIQNLIVQTILSVLTILAILNTVGMTVHERTGEIGTLRSLGHTRTEIVFQFVLEGIYLGIFGAIFGSLAGALSISAINAAGITTALPGASTDVVIEADFVVSAFVMAISLGMVSVFLGTLVPAWRASRLSIVDALRRNI